MPAPPGLSPAAGARRNDVAEKADGAQPRPGPGQRSGPSGETGRAETLAAAKQFDLAAQATRRRRQSGVRRALDAYASAARARGDEAGAAVALWLRSSAGSCF